MSNIKKKKTPKHKLAFTERQIALLFDLVDDLHSKMSENNDYAYNVYTYDEIGRLLEKLETVDIDYFTIKGIKI